MRIRFKRKERLPRNEAAARSGSGQAAYSLVELVVGAAIVGFVATSLYGAFAAGFCIIRSTRENLRATQIMVQKLEAVRLFTWSQVNDTNNYLTPVFVERYDPENPNKNQRGPQYTGYVQASLPAAGDLPEAYRTNMRTITVSLHWTNYNGAKVMVHKRDMRTRVVRNGMQNYIWGAL